MSSAEPLVYGLGRLAFGAAVLAAPEAVGRALLGKDARRAPVRVSFRFYGTRDVVLGLGTLRAATTGGDAAPWVAAGIAADALDAAVQVVEWSDLPPAKRVPGLLAAAGAAVAGVVLLARR
jgi:hypothetical protein